MYEISCQKVAYWLQQEVSIVSRVGLQHSQRKELAAKRQPSGHFLHIDEVAMGEFMNPCLYCASEV